MVSMCLEPVLRVSVWEGSSSVEVRVPFGDYVGFHRRWVNSEAAVNQATLGIRIKSA
jgi:hypothetical protein